MNDIKIEMAPKSQEGSRKKAAAGESSKLPLYFWQMSLVMATSMMVPMRIRKCAHKDAQ